MPTSTFRDVEGRTLLHGAVSTSKVRAIQKLLVLGLPMTDEDNSGITPFHVAAENFEFIDALSTLLGYANMQGAGHHEMVKMDLAALHLACLQTPICIGHAFILLDRG
jgi:ankyrin repeat protein